MAFDGFFCVAVANELNAWAGAKVEKIHQSAPTCLYLCLYREGKRANLILSAFAGRAKKSGIGMNIQGALPPVLSITDSDLCVLLSNALENALCACREIAASGTDCTIDVQFYQRDGKLFLQVVNPCREDIPFEDGIPITDRPGHGIGVQSICTIVQRYGGLYAFTAQKGKFILRLSV